MVILVVLEGFLLKKKYVFLTLIVMLLIMILFKNKELNQI